MRGDFRILALFSLVVFALLLAAGQQSGIFRDELYYIACANRLAWGYVDHPPLSIALLATVRATLGESLLALRLPAALAGATTVFLSGLIARALGAGRGAMLLAALAVAITPQVLAISSFYSMNALELVAWALLELLAIRILAGGSPRLWLAFGVVAGLGLLDKYSVALFAGSLIAGMLCTSQRRQLLTPWPWLGGALALLLFAPHLWWEQANGWPTREFMANATARKNVHLNAIDFFTGQLTLGHPLAAPLWIAGLIGLLTARRFAAQRPLGVAYLIAFAVLVTQGGKAYYLSPIYPMLFAAGAVWLEAAARRRAWRWPVPVAAALLLIAGVAIAPLAAPMLPPAVHVRYAAAVGLGPPAMEKSKLGALPQHVADRYGWQELVAAVGGAVDQLSPEDRARAVIFAGNYGEAGALEVLGRGLPRVISGHNNYWLWGPGDLRPDDPILIVAGRGMELQPYFDSFELVGRTHCEWCMPFEDGIPIYLARGLNKPIDQLWPKVKRFI
ncbi:MAG TPA: glycosyltransferase family 39 protein [Candidatus Dormibacteraeota bacterium]|nr:glycosyltransferase family 39 protein [Candidatus Dormibacteraeota bacterium]